VGDTPPGFTTDVALSPEGLDKTATYIAVVNDQTVDSGTPFTVNELRADRVADYGGSSTRDEFIRRAQQVCDRMFLGFDPHHCSAVWARSLEARAAVPLIVGADAHSERRCAYLSARPLSDEPSFCAARSVPGDRSRAVP
jgi:hypothetical protein